MTAIERCRTAALGGHDAVIAPGYRSDVRRLLPAFDPWLLGRDRTSHIAASSKGGSPAPSRTSA